MLNNQKIWLRFPTQILLIKYKMQLILYVKIYGFVFESQITWHMIHQTPCVRCYNITKSAVPLSCIYSMWNFTLNLRDGCSCVCNTQTMWGCLPQTRIRFMHMWIHAARYTISSVPLSQCASHEIQNNVMKLQFILIYRLHKSCLHCIPLQACLGRHLIAK